MTNHCLLVSFKNIYEPGSSQIKSHYHIYVQTHILNLQAKRRGHCFGLDLKLYQDGITHGEQEGFCAPSGLSAALSSQVVKFIRMWIFYVCCPAVSHRGALMLKFQLCFCYSLISLILNILTNISCYKCATDSGVNRISCSFPRDHYCCPPLTVKLIRYRRIRGVACVL